MGNFGFDDFYVVLDVKWDCGFHFNYFKLKLKREFKCTTFKFYY